MAKQNGPTLRGRWLGGKLRDLREDHGLKIADVAEYLKRSSGTVSRYETGVYPVQGDDLLKLIDLYQVSELDRRTELLQLAENVTQRGWWGGYAKYLGQPFADFVWMENRAEKIDILEINSLPGLVQTSEYATTLIGNGPQRGDEHAVKRLVEARMTRGQVITKDSAPRIRLLIHELVLGQDVGGAAVMKPQLGHILKQSGRSNIELRLIPGSSWQYAADGMGPGFTRFTLPDDYPEVVCVETPSGPLYQESPDIDLFVNSYDALWNAALTPNETAARITTRMKDFA